MVRFHRRSVGRTGLGKCHPSAPQDLRRERVGVDLGLVRHSRYEIELLARWPCAAPARSSAGSPPGPRRLSFSARRRSGGLDRARPAVGCANSIGPLLRACLLEPDLGDGPADLFDVVDVDRVYEHVRSPNSRKLVESAPLSTLPLSEHLAKALCDLGRSLINEQFATALKNDPRRHRAASVARCP